MINIEEEHLRDILKIELGAEGVWTYDLENEIVRRIKAFAIPVVVSSFITSSDKGKHFVVKTDQLDEIKQGSVVCLLETYPEDIHLFVDKNGDEIWIDADDVDRKK